MPQEVSEENIQQFWLDVLKQAAKSNQHSARARRRSLDRALAKMSKKRR